MKRIYKFIYRVGIPNQKSLQYKIWISADKSEVEFQQQADPKLEFWKRLEYCKCSNCNIDAKNNKYCPVAENILPIISDFKNIDSWEEIKVDVECNRRHYFSKTSVQDALKSLIGLIMASSNCPHFKFLKPLAKLHLPFASYEETISRVAGAYLLEEYLKDKNTPPSLEGLNKNYHELTQVNHGIISRIRGLENGDAGKNAMADLDGLIQMFTMEYEMNLDDMYSLFEIENPDPF